MMQLTFIKLKHEIYFTLNSNGRQYFLTFQTITIIG